MFNRSAARRVLISAAVLALVASAPGFTGVASASDHHGSSSSGSMCSSGATPLTAPQQAGVDAAAAAYAASIHTAKDALRSSLTTIRDKVVADPAVAAARQAMLAAHSALAAAHDSTQESALELAYENAKQAYRTALRTAAAANQAAIDAAWAAYRGALKTAETAYVSALTTVFGSAAAIPADLLSPQGHASLEHHGGSVGHHDDCEQEDD